MHKDVDVKAGAGEVTLVVDYAKHKIKPGAKYQLGSAWTDGAANSEANHLYGFNWTPGMGEPEIVMPK